MPQKKNKPSRNGFWQFAMECKKRHPNKNVSNQELQDYAGRKWANMSKEERGPYELRASIDKNNASSARYTSDGVDVEHIENQIREQIQHKTEMKSYIDDLIKQSASAGQLSQEVFLILHINYLTYHPSDDKFYICEVSIAPFSVEEGVHMDNIFHALVKPGKLPLGFYGGAQTYSKESHQMIELATEDNGDNTEEVFKKLTKYLNGFKIESKLPVLYTQEKLIEMCQKVFDNFAYTFQSPEEFNVYNLEYLFYQLRNGVAREGRVWHSDTFAYSEIDRDLFAYTGGISCNFHELSDLGLYCSRSMVIRQAFTICSNCCEDAKVRKIQGHHMPNKSGTYVRNDDDSTSQTTTSDQNTLENSYVSESSSTFSLSDFPSLDGASTTADSGWSQVAGRGGKPAWNRKNFPAKGFRKF